MTKTSVLLYRKKGDAFSLLAFRHILELGCHVETYELARGDHVNTPEGASYDFVISYLCPAIIPESILRLAQVSAVNFHPGPPEYPGIGCVNFALYDEASQFGATCHVMDPSADTGKIIDTKRFYLTSSDTVETTLARTYAALFELFLAFCENIEMRSHPLPNGEVWLRSPYRRADLDRLCCLDLSMSEDEIRRRVRATHYAGFPGPRFEFGFGSFKYTPNEGF